MKETVLEIETKNKIYKVKNPRKAREKDYIFFLAVEVMDSEGKWHKIIKSFGDPVWKVRGMVGEINDAIRQKETYVNVELYF